MTKPSSSAAPPCVMALFGVTGDLTQRLLMPSLYNLASARSLPDGFRLLGIGRRDWTDDRLRKQLSASLKQFWGPRPHAPTVRWLMQRVSYQKCPFDEAAAFDALARRIKEISRGKKPNVLFYLAVAPQFIASTATQLSRVGLFEEGPGEWRRLVVEKPFGHDLASAVALNRELQRQVRESQIYRIDHFAGKDAVQDLSVFRFANSVIEPLWHRSLIDSVQITVAETVGVEERAEFYEKSGAMRDMVPNHLVELLSLIAMEPPVSLSAEHVRAKQVELLDAVRRVPGAEAARRAVRAQYAAGKVDGKKVPAYRRERGVDPKSTTETYVALRVDVDNWRWAGVPFFLRTGKRLCRASTEVALRFKRPPTPLFHGGLANEFVFTLQPDPGVSLSFGAKAPGLDTRVIDGGMDYRFAAGPFGAHAQGYERLLLDVMLGRPTLFQSAAFVEAGWRLVQPVLDAWAEARKGPLPGYAAGSAGPAAADRLLARDGHAWRPLSVADA